MSASRFFVIVSKICSKRLFTTIVSSRLGSSSCLMTMTCFHIKILSKSCAKLLTLSLHLASSSAERGCLNSIKFRSCLSFESAFCSVTSSSLVGMIKSSCKKPRKIERSTNNPKVELKLHIFTSVVHHRSKSLLNTV